MPWCYAVIARAFLELFQISMPNPGCHDKSVEYGYLVSVQFLLDKSDSDIGSFRYNSDQKRMSTLVTHRARTSQFLILDETYENCDYFLLV